MKQIQTPCRSAAGIVIAASWSVTTPLCWSAPPRIDSDAGRDDVQRIVDLLGDWGMAVRAQRSDLNADGIVDAADLAAVLIGAPRTAARICPVETGPGQPIIRPGGIAGGGIAGGGMAGDGWDGPALGSVTVFWHVEGTTPDFGAGQRQALIEAMQTWADVVQITFQELPIANADQSVDWTFATGDHCAIEGDECGDDDCPFDGVAGVLAHAGFPPGVNSTCVNPMPETWAGNVHFDDDEGWEQDDSPLINDGLISLALVAAHELGHAIGLTHDSGGGGPHIMEPSLGVDDALHAPSASDIANIQAGYAAGRGSVITLDQTGIWVDGGYGGGERGTQNNPFDTVLEGTGGVPPFTTDVTVHIHAGTYDESLTIAQPMHLVAENGIVTIQ